ncbi:hypothetical protein BGX23_001663 [Mortierella sp. AD031]|nr:hypothetical protein BGX23_001663 [Mortierella sp. AD031]
MITRIPLRSLLTGVARIRTGTGTGTGTGHTPRRHFNSNTSAIPHAHYNVVFDIDGVLIKGKKVLPQTHRALGLLQSNNVPYIFLTNGGGLKETEKAEQLSKKMGVHYEDSNVLVVGGNGSECRHVAEHYGFKHIVTPEEKYLQNVHRPVEAIMVFHDSVDWGRDLQVTIDALTSQDGYLNTVKTQKELHTTPQTVPLYFSNSDLVWSNEYPTPRFAQGTFRTCLERIFEDMTGHKLQYTLYGKPMTTTYQYAEAVLNRIAPSHMGPDGMPKPRSVYAIGDNPYADIAGANGYGWNSLLVKTGVFQPEGDENHHTHPATAVVDDVEDAVRWIISREIRKEHPF